MYEMYVSGIHTPPCVKLEKAATIFDQDSPLRTNGQAKVYAGSSRRMNSKPMDDAKSARVAAAKTAANAHLQILEVKAEKELGIRLHLLHAGEDGLHSALRAGV